MNMRRITAIALALLLALNIVGCSGQSGSGGDAGTANLSNGAVAPAQSDGNASAPDAASESGESGKTVTVRKLSFINGEPDNYVLYLYDEDGNCVREADYKANGYYLGMYSDNEYVGGECVKTTSYMPGGSGVILREKDGAGKETKNVFCYNYPDTGTVYRTTLSEYDEDGKITRRSTYTGPDDDLVLESYTLLRGAVQDSAHYQEDYNGDNELTSYSVAEYDDRGNNTKTTTYRRDGSISEYTVYEDTESAHNYTSYEADGTIRSTYINEFYPENGKIKTLEICSYGGGRMYSGSRREYEYDENNRVKKMIYVSYDTGSSKWGSENVSTYTYDENDRVIEMVRESFSEIETTTYIYGDAPLSDYLCDVSAPPLEYDNRCPHYTEMSSYLGGSVEDLMAYMERDNESFNFEEYWAEIEKPEELHRIAIKSDARLRYRANADGQVTCLNIFGENGVSQKECYLFYTLCGIPLSLDVEQAQRILAESGWNAEDSSTMTFKKDDAVLTLSTVDGLIKSLDLIVVD